MGHAYPEGILTNADLEKIVDTNDEWITTRTGIKQRHKAAANEYTSQFGAKAALLQSEASADAMRFHVQEAGIVELPALERRLGAIAAIAQVAPLGGLLGTLLGMMTTFRAFEQGGHYALAGALSGGMWQALISVAGSLMLAIPAHLAHQFLSARVRSIVRDVEWSGNEIMKYLLTEYRGVAPAADPVPPSAAVKP